MLFQLDGHEVGPKDPDMADVHTVQGGISMAMQFLLDPMRATPTSNTPQQFKHKQNENV